MRYKVLITGKNDSVIDDFFSQMKENFEAVTTSSRYDDIIEHMELFRPDVFIYCLHNESQDSIDQVASLEPQLSQANVPIIIIGSKEDCAAFEGAAAYVANMTIHIPAATNIIQNKILMLIKGRQAFKKDSGQNVSAGNNASVGTNAPQSPYSDLLPPSMQEEGSSGRKHILVVDDSSMMLKMVKEHLHDKYDVATAVSGKIALKFLERKKTDLILLDYEMPDEDGPAVLEKLRASNRTRNIPVVFLTGVTESSKIMNALVLKPQSYLLKPIDREKLLNTIAKIIG